MITIENYEEYFLLYVDDELPAELRTAVERFVDGHPETREELEVMLQCRLRPDQDHPFPDKASLLHYEDSLLLYIDGELDTQEKAAVETLAAQHPSVAKELKRLKLTVSHPDKAIVFADKESLYRYEKDKRVVLLPWLRAGVAAAVLVAATLLLLPRGHKETAQPVVVAKKVPAAVTPSTPRTLNTVRKEENGGENALTSTGSRSTRKEPSTGKKPGIADERLTGNKPSNPNERPTRNEPSTGNEPLIAQSKPAVDTGNRPAMAATEPVKQTSPPTDAVAAVYISREKSSFATQDLLREEQEANGQTVLTPETGGKNKLRGIFRRVTRAFGKTAERDSEGQREVLISAFQVELK